MSESSATVRPRDALARFHRAMLDLSADDLADLFSADAVYEFPFLAPGRPARYQGREEIRAGFGAAWAAAPVRVDEIRDVVAHETTDPEVIIAEQVFDATLTTTGRRFTSSFLLVMRVRDSLIVHVRDYADALRTAHALGRLPAVVASLGGQQPAPPDPRS